MLHPRLIPLLALTCIHASLAAQDAPTDFVYLQRVGLYGEADRTWDGGFYSAPSRTEAVTDSGYIAGETSYQVPGLTEYHHGQRAWVADAAGRTWAVGLTDATHTSAEGERWSQISRLTERGLAIGRSRRFDVSAQVYSFWTAEPGGPTVPFEGEALNVNDRNTIVGFTGSWSSPRGFIQSSTGQRTPIHLDEDQGDFTLAYGLNVHGTSAGRSWRSDDSRTSSDYSWAWVRKTDGRIDRVGLFDERHTAPSGRVRHQIGLSPTSDFAAGFSQRFSGEASNGLTAWIAHPNGRLVVVGLYGPGYTRSDDYALSSVEAFNDRGYSVGTSVLYATLISSNHAWVADPEGNTHRIGLYDESMSGPYGRQSSFPHDITDSGYVIGESTIFHATDENAFPVGHEAWIADITGKTTRIGLFVEDRAPYNLPGGVTESGYVWGRTVGYGSASETAWIYHHPTRRTVALTPPAALEGFSVEVNHVYEDGTAIGRFFDESFTAAMPSRAFVWTPDHGVLLVDEHMDIDPESAGWSYFSNALHRNREGTLVGVGAFAEDAGAGTWVARSTTVPPPAAIDYVGRLGLYGARHTHDSGFRWSAVVDVADTGYVLGTSALFVGADDVPADGERAAQTAWRGDLHGTTVRVGLYDAAHTRDDGRQEARAVAINDNGTVIGSATRFQGHAARGESAWVAFQNGSVRRLGFRDAAHTGANGAQVSRPVALNEADQVAGYSLHPDTWAATAWLAAPDGASARLGFLDTAHTAPDGSRVSLPVALNDRGHVVGTSEFHGAGPGAPGLSSWVRHTDGQHRMIGLTGGVHRAASGLHEAQVRFLNAQSMMAGHSTRYRPGQSSSNGQTAWLTAIDGPNRPIGFHTGLHGGRDHLAFSRVLGLNNAGYAVGYSQQFPEDSTRVAAARGRTAWAASYAGGTAPVGLYDAEHSRGPFQHNDIRGQNDSDGVVGTAQRFEHGIDRGLDGWFAKASGWTLKLALPDERHRRADGYARHVPRFVTNSLIVAGASVRYHGGAEAGQTAWVFDVAARTYAAIELSVRAGDHFAWSVITELREDGTALGVYRKFSDSGASLGDRAFKFEPGRGAFDLGAVMDVRPYDVGWDLLGSPIGSTSARQIIGHGVLSGYRSSVPGRSFSQGVYLVQD